MLGLITISVKNLIFLAFIMAVKNGYINGWAVYAIASLYCIIGAAEIIAGIRYFREQNKS